MLHYKKSYLLTWNKQRQHHIGKAFDRILHFKSTDFFIDFFSCFSWVLCPISIYLTQMRRQHYRRRASTFYLYSKHKGRFFLWHFNTDGVIMQQPREHVLLFYHGKETRRVHHIHLPNTYDFPDNFDKPTSNHIWLLFVFCCLFV